MHGIVLGDVIKYIIMTAACIWIAIIAVMKLHGHNLNVPNGWYSPFFGIHLNLNWTGVITEVNQKIKEDGYSLFGVFFMMMTFRGFFAALGRPCTNIRYAEDPLHPLARRSQQNERFCKHHSAAYSICAHYQSNFTGLVVLPSNEPKRRRPARLTLNGYYRQLSITFCLLAWWACCSPVCWALS